MRLLVLRIDLLRQLQQGADNCRTTSHFWTDYERPQNIGYFMLVIDPQKFLPAGQFMDRVDDMLEEFKACPTAPGVERMYIPGEIEANKLRSSTELGVELSDAVAEELRRVGTEYGVEAAF